MLGFLVLRRLLGVTGVAPATSAATLTLYCAAPIQVFYAGTALPDGLACLLALVAVLAHEEWRGGGPRARAWLALMVVAAALATVVKAPVFLPAACAIAWLALRRDRTSELVRPGYVITGASVLVALVAWNAYAEAVNAEWRGQLPAAVPSSRLYWYFSSLADRQRPELYGEVLETLVKYLLNPVTAALMIWGLAVSARGEAPRIRLFRAWWLGCVGMILVFFNLCWRHSYYLLPCVVPFAYWAGSGLCGALRRVPGSRTRGIAAVLLLVATYGLSARSVRRLHESDRAPIAVARVAGEFLRGSTRPTDFVVYVVGASDHQPQHLFFARRDGYMLSAGDLSAELLQRIWNRYLPEPATGRRLVFVPEQLRAELSIHLTDLGLREVARGPAGIVLESR